MDIPFLKMHGLGNDFVVLDARVRHLGVTAEAERQPAESVSPLVPRNLSVVVRLRPVDPLPDRYRIFRLPLEVRFDRSWREQGSGWLRPLTG